MLPCMSIHQGLQLFLALCSLILPATAVLGQQLSISGTVRDSSGVVPDATVTLRAGRNAARTANTDSAGHYVFDGLSAGYYELSFAKGGFDTITRNLALQPNTGTVDVILTVGAVSTSLTVTDVAGKGTASRLVGFAFLPLFRGSSPLAVKSLAL